MEAKWLSPAPVLKGFRKAPVDEVGLRTARVCVSCLGLLGDRSHQRGLESATGLEGL